MVQIEVDSATVLLQRNGTDIVFLKTSLPCPFPEEAISSQPSLQMKFDTTQGTGIKYVKDNFGIEPEVIDAR